MKTPGKLCLCLDSIKNGQLNRKVYDLWSVVIAWWGTQQNLTFLHSIFNSWVMRTRPFWNEGPKGSKEWPFYTFWLLWGSMTHLGEEEFLFLWLAWGRDPLEAEGQEIRVSKKSLFQGSFQSPSVQSIQHARCIVWSFMLQ